MELLADRQVWLSFVTLSFLILMGAVLIAESLEFEVSKGNLYFAMAFSFIVEMLNIQMRKARRAAQPH